MEFKKSITASLLLSAAMLPFTPANAQGGPGKAKPKWVAGQIIVKPRAGLSENQLDKILRRHGGRSKKWIRRLGAHIISVPPHAEEAIISAMSNNPNIEYCEKDKLIELSAVTLNDPKIGSQWHLPKMQASEAWATSTGEDITVAILDTGVEATHPDLVDNLVPGWNVVSNNNDTSPIMWHGTSVAGVVAATSNNSTGVASIAWNAKIMPIRVSNKTNGVAQLSSLVDGILWAADHGADVANISYNLANASYLNDAAQYFRSKGGVTVVSAGNSNMDGGFSDNPYIITVSATGSNDGKANFSNYGNYIDVAAPGVSIYTTYANGSYKNASGTSFASPATAGVVALIMAANPHLTPEEIETVLEQSADDPIAGTDWHSYFGHGRVNAATAVLLAQGTTEVDTQAPSATIFSPDANESVSGSVLIEINATDDTGVTGVDLYADEQFVGRDITAPYQFSWDSTQVDDGNVMFTAYAQDSAGNEVSSEGLSVNVANLANNGQDLTPPSVNILNPAEDSTINGSLTIDVTSNDNIGIQKLTLFIDGIRYRSTNYSTLSAYWLTNDISSGSHTITAIAKDTAGNTANTSILVWKAGELNDVDTEAPNATIISPQNNTVASGNVLVDVDATDNTGVTGVDLYANEQFVGRDTTAPYQFSWDSTQVVDGSVTFTAYAQDSAGNETSSESITIDIANNLPDTEAPMISIISPQNNTIVSANLLIDVNATDNINVAGVDLYADDQFVGRDVTAPYQFSWDTTQVADGNVTLTAYAQDSAGNESSSENLTVNVANVNNGGQDHIPPNVNIVNPVDGGIISGYLTIGVTSSDNDEIQKLTLFIDGIRYRSTNYSFMNVGLNTGNLSNGIHTISAIAKDITGNTATTSITVQK